MYFDPATQSITMRVLYDGSGTAGKTTNLIQIAEQFSASRNGSLISPETPEGGRTRFFDWIELRTGRVEGFPLRCQLLSVPGQFVYAERRIELLKTADVIVCVCDSGEDAIRKMQVGVRFLHTALASLKRTDVPILVQANKQDLPNALPIAEIAHLLGLPESSVHGASAATGVGVRKTLLGAIHAAVDNLRVMLQEGGTQGLPQGVETPDQLYQRMQALPEGDLDVAQDVVGQVLDESDAAKPATMAWAHVMGKRDPEDDRITLETIEGKPIDIGWSTRPPAHPTEATPGTGGPQTIPAGDPKRPS